MAIKLINGEIHTVDIDPGDECACDACAAQLECFEVLPGYVLPTPHEYLVHRYKSTPEMLERMRRAAQPPQIPAEPKPIEHFEVKIVWNAPQLNEVVAEKSEIDELRERFKNWDFRTGT